MKHLKHLKLYYKVVYEDQSTFQNRSSGWVLYNPHALSYEIGKTTVPKIEGSGIFVFETIDEAREYKKTFFKPEKLKIVSGYGSKRKRTPKYMAGKTDDFINFWNDRRNHLTNDFRVSMVEGTIILNEFTPTAILQ